MSTGATDHLRPPPEQTAWRGVPDAAVCAAVKEARQDAARKVIDSLGSIELSPRGPRLDKTLADAKVRADLETWLMNRPVTSVNFQDDMAVRVTVAVEGEPLWNELLAAAGERDDLGFPRDDQSRFDVRREVLRRVQPTVGRALAKTGGAPAVAVQRHAVAIPRDPPRWVVDQVDARGSSKAVNGRLKTARAAEAVARDRLRGRIEALSLSRNLTLGDAAKRDDRVRGAIDRAVERARPRKVNYLSDGGAEVSFSLDLRDLWYELEEQ
jgi:hypothetical protein